MVGMHSRIFWIDVAVEGRLAILARPRPGEWLEDEIAAWQAEGLQTILSLLEREEAVALGLRHEDRLCAAAAIEFIAFPIPDRGVPRSMASATALIQELVAKLRGGRTLGIHCRAGIGRSAVIAAGAMIALGYEADDALEAIVRARGVAVPDTEEQRRWLLGAADRWKIAGA